MPSEISSELRHAREYLPTSDYGEVRRDWFAPLGSEEWRMSPRHARRAWTAIGILCLAFLAVGLLASR